ncbi:hypothetical protein D6C98_09132 [Aureobasidium pullulans]|nr:hypothetical protein D6D26_10130 [Aureobasidium pullulans]THY41793.1 hypothetical protein D6C98_09132 [Aureobasidium pullulans]
MTTKMEELQALEKELLEEIKETKRLNEILQDQIKRDEVEMPVLPQGNELEKGLAATSRFIAAVEAAKAKDPGTDIEEMVACRSPEMLQVVKDMARYKELIFVYRWLTEPVGDSQITLHQRHGLDKLPDIAAAEMPESVFINLEYYHQRLFDPEHGTMTVLGQLWRLDDHGIPVTPFGAALHENFDKAVAAVPRAIQRDEHGMIIYGLEDLSRATIPEIELTQPVEDEEDLV